MMIKNNKIALINVPGKMISQLSQGIIIKSEALSYN